jgi:hypothetical protein
MTLALLALVALDSLVIHRVETSPVLDGRVGQAEYGAPTLVLEGPAGPVRLWLRRDSASVYFAALLPDASPSWRDALVLCLDTGGDGADGPQHDDFQWEIHRVLDSSIVFRGQAGTWRAPRDDPDWRLGPDRAGGGWEVRGASTAQGWSVELRFDLAYFQAGRGQAPRIALLLFDDDPQRWRAWPPAAGMAHPTAVLGHPSGWAALSLGP